ncbi:CrcB family protein [Corynebacterium sp.]|uniref:fluoride efflux transporter FluC n=1 Tax=Corynebacterium sp. TaxID=1720 RepID=UPI0026DC006E|nr:CrcB family protein [Corynebacterium sp.]MDO5033007.1 CrcB family protein [Corynebacterium sp.]
MSSVLEVLWAVACVGLGAFVGGAGRYWFSTILPAPACTFAANMVGSASIGVAWGLLEGRPDLWAGAFEALVVIGFAGGMSTWSTLAKELGEMLRQRRYTRLASYAFWTLGLGIVLAWRGAWAASFFV